MNTFFNQKHLLDLRFQISFESEKYNIQALLNHHVIIN